VSNWIWDAFHRETANQLLLFRRVVHGDGPIVGGSIDVAARGSFRVWVDGGFVAHHDLQDSAPGASAIHVPLPSGGSTMTVTIGVHLLGVGTHHVQRALGGLHVTGSVVDAAGATHVLDSDSAWEVAVPPGWQQNTQQMVWSTGFREHVDRTRDDGLGWGGAVAYPDDARPVLVDRDVVTTRVDLDPFRVAAPDGVVRFHVPHQLVGFLGLEAVVAPAASVAVDGAVPSSGAAPVHSAAPVGIVVRYGETATADGAPTAERQGITAIDSLVVGPGATEHRFWHRRTFRDLEISAPPGVTIRAWFDVVGSPRPSVAFASPSARDASMHEVSLATLAVGRQDLYEDCPLREGGHYVADARVQALFDLALHGPDAAGAMAARSVRTFALGQDDDGMIPALWPSGTRHRIPDFALQWVCAVEDVVRFTGDRVLLDEPALLGDLWPAAVRAVEWAVAQWDGNAFVVDRPGWWPFIDWYRFGADALQAAIDAQFAVALRSGVALAARVGDVERESTWRRMLDDVLASMSTPVRTPHAATILLTGLDPDVARSLVDPTALDGFMPETGYFCFWLARAWLVLGRPDRVRALLDSYWGSMLDAGAGTWWEQWSPTWEPGPPDGASLCHPWSAAPAVLLPMLALGVDPFVREATDMRFAPEESARVSAPGVVAELHTPWGLVGTGEGGA
jgi:hypothetical protein